MVPTGTPNVLVENPRLADGPRPKRPKDNWWYRCGSCRYLAIAGSGDPPVGTSRPLEDYDDWRYMTRPGGVAVKRSMGKTKCPACQTKLPLFGEQEAPHPSFVVLNKDYAPPVMPLAAGEEGGPRLGSPGVPNGLTKQDRDQIAEEPQP